MSALDGPPNEIVEHIERISEQLTATITSAWSRGIKDGMEVAALVSDNMGTSLDQLGHDVLASMCVGVRDTIRLTALSIETPK